MCVIVTQSVSGRLVWACREECLEYTLSLLNALHQNNTCCVSEQQPLCWERKDGATDIAPSISLQPFFKIEFVDLV